MAFTVTASAPGIFQYGANRGIVQNQDYKTPSDPAPTGSVVIVYLTEIGITVPAVADGSTAPSPPLAQPAGTATAEIGEVSAPVLFLGLTPGSVGLAQANIQIPALLSGDYSLDITVGGRTSRPAILSVKGLPGTVPEGLPSGTICASGNVGYVQYSLAKSVAKMAGEVSIGGSSLCDTCGLKLPRHGDFVTKLNAARSDGLVVDACYDGSGTMNYLRMRP